ncbi:hypothetical protein CYY_007239 [Polysphondylium violaceum]|uniref:F-box domain-containing protein n=1 Tax=Polysphondylium violaceum TaxID=133409 RepID=A0A8J4V2E7_9MYCE|nr:hypothetical protein CYY_007239 [Polysphondylium violaceum]
MKTISTLVFDNKSGGDSLGKRLSTSTTSPLATLFNHNGVCMNILLLPLELLEKIFKLLNQKTLYNTCLVSKQWNKAVYMVWHTIDLSKSHNHFTHLTSRIKTSISNIKSQKIKYLEAICNNLISNNGFLIPPLITSKKDGSSQQLSIFLKNYNSSSSSGNSSNSSNSINSNSNSSILYSSNSESDKQQQLYIKQQQDVSLNNSSLENNNLISDQTNNSIENTDLISNNSNLNNNSNSSNDSNNNNNSKKQKQQSKQMSVQMKLEKEIEYRIERKMFSFFVGLCNRYERIEVLDLSGCTDLRMDSLSMLVKHFSQTLRKLITRRCKSPTITDASLADLFKQQYLPKLNTLSIGEMNSVGDLTIASVCLYCPELTALGLARCSKITDQSIINLSQSPIASRLSIIGLNHLSHLQDESILALGMSSPNLSIFSVSNLKNLTSDTLSKIFLNCNLLGSIDLSGCVNIDDTVLDSISMRCHQLFQLNISRSTKVTSLAVKRVVQNCKKLSILFLCKTTVDDECILSIIENLNLLEILYASSCCNLTDTSVGAILNLGTERLGKMIVSFSFCPNISKSLLSILHSFTKTSTSPSLSSSCSDSLEDKEEF